MFGGDGKLSKRDEFGLKPRQRAFADEYIINKGNAYQAAIKAGYSEKYYCEVTPTSHYPVQ